jgi:hypothetical protein
MIGVSGYALATGDPMKIFTPFDSDGKPCGAVHDNGLDLTDYPYKLFTDLNKLWEAPDPQAVLDDPAVYNAVCVKKCPTLDINFNWDDLSFTIPLENANTTFLAADSSWNL